MNIIENIRLAVAALRANKMRALLTMLGIIIGIAAVIGILTVGDSLSSYVTDSMSTFGANNITIMLQEREDILGMSSMSAMMGMTSIDEEHLITDEMLDALRAQYPDDIVGIGLSESAGSGQAKSGRDYANVSVTGINEDYLDINSVTLLKGRNIATKDIEGRRQVAIVSEKLVESIFDGDMNAAIGNELVVYMGTEIQTFNIIGVYEYVATPMSLYMASEKDISTSLYIPVSTAKRIAGADDGYSSITITSADSASSQTFAAMATAFLNKYYSNNKDYKVTSISMETMLESVNSVMDTISIGIAVIAGISLLVGGIGVMNIMLVSVTERTREIGTRKAIGATNKDIRIQFVVESMIVCLIGGVFGIITGAILGYIGSALISVPTSPSLFSIVLSVGFSLLIGVFFGYYPANKAAQLDPIEALRYE